MKNLVLPAFLSIALCNVVQAQQVTETVFGDSGWNSPYRIWQMPDGGLAVVSGIALEKRLYHIDLSGNLLGAYNLPNPTLSDFVEPTADGSAFYYGAIGAAGYTIHHLDLAGQTLDSITYNPPDPFWDDYFFAIDQAPNGDFVLAYEDQEPPQGVRVVRLNPQGNVVFNKYTSSFDPDFYANHLTVLPNGRTVVVVLDYTQGYRVICYSPTGALLWTKGVPQIPGFPEEFGLVPLGNGNTVFFGYQGFVGNTWVDGYAAAYKPDGSFAYNRTFQNDLPNFEPYKAFADGDAVVLAGNYSDANEYGLAVVKLDAAGQTVFARKFHRLSGTDEMEAAMSLNGDYLISGFHWELLPQGGYGSDKGYLLSLQPDGTFNWLASGTDVDVRLISDICQLGNGDIVALGQGFQPVPGDLKNLLLHLSDVGPVYSQLIEGQILHDSIQNCQPDASEPDLSGWVLKAETAAGNRYAVTDASGRYHIRLNASGAQVSATVPNALWEPCQPTYAVDFAGASPDTAYLDMPVRQTGQCPLFSLDVATPRLRRCFDNTYYCYGCNNGTTVAENAVLGVTLDSLTTYVSASLPLAGQNGQALTFQLGSLAPGQCVSLNLVANVSCDAPLGQTHCLSASLSSDNHCPSFPNPEAGARVCLSNIGSYDPNDKRAFVDGEIREGAVLQNAEIEYQIRFQNTGTDTAFNIVIVDTIDNALDINTLRPGISSHPYVFQMQGSNVAKFVFHHINLPDSNANKVASNGFVNFRVAQKPDLPILTEIRNKAGIYFDHNAAIVTNTHQLVVSTSTPTTAPKDHSALIEVFPNPAVDGQCWVLCTGPDRLHQVWVFDATGRKVSHTEPNGQKALVQLPESPGAYWVKTMLADGRSAVKRIIR